MAADPKAPPIYKPTPVKLAAPPVYRPQQDSKPGVQRQVKSDFKLETRPAPPVYRPAQSAPGVQPRSATTRSREYGTAAAVRGFQTARQISALPMIKAGPQFPYRQPQLQMVSASLQRSIKPATHRVNLRQAALPQLVLQCMQNEDPEVEMKSQFFSEGKLVDLNCGRYCVAAAIKYLREKNNLEVGDPFHELDKPEKTKVGPLNLRIGWSPGYEGEEFAEEIDKPGSLVEWQSKLDEHGPLIVSGKLGRALFLWVGHYILIIGADTARNRLICKDPLKGNDTVKHDFDWIDDRIEHVYRIKKID